MRLTCGIASFSPCTKTKQKFAEAGIAFHEVEVTTNRAAFEYITEELGYSQVPVVI
jgi:glutaredoxin-like protein NrdH